MTLRRQEGSVRVSLAEGARVLIVLCNRAGDDRVPEKAGSQYGQVIRKIAEDYPSG